MARTAVASSMLDMRSVSILFDQNYPLVFLKPPNIQKRQIPPFRRDVQDLPLRSPCSFDSKKSWGVLGCAMALNTLALGVLHSTLLYQSYMNNGYDFSYIQMTLISSATYAMFLLMSPVGSCLVNSWGPRFTITFGLLLGFLGLIHMSLNIHMIADLVACIAFLGPGCAFVQTGTTGSVVDFFMKSLLTAMTMLTLVSPVATMIFVAFTYLFGVHGFMESRWVMLCYGLFFLAAIGLTRRLPQTIRIPGHRDSLRAAEVAHKVKKCIEANEPREKRNSTDICTPTPRIAWTKKEYSCTCVCVTDVSILRDTSFYLWTLICFCAMLTFYVPFVCILLYARYEFGYNYFVAFGFISGFCVASAMGRVITMLLNNYNFHGTRSIFQFALVLNACIYFTMYKASTFGWVLAVFIGLGLAEGMLAVIIPRQTLLSFPRKNLSSVWPMLTVFNGLAVFTGPTFQVLVRDITADDLIFPGLVIGALQIVAALLAFLLPQDGEAAEAIAAAAARREPVVTTASRSSPPYSRGLPSTVGEDVLLTFANLQTSNFPVDSSKFHCTACAEIGVNPLEPCKDGSEIPNLNRCTNSD